MNLRGNGKLKGETFKVFAAYLQNIEHVDAATFVRKILQTNED